MSVAWKDVEKWHKRRRGIISGRNRRIVSKGNLKRKCPGCKKAWLTLGRVNHHPAVMVGGDSKCQWFCSLCPWEEYSKKDIIDESKPYLNKADAIDMRQSAQQLRRIRRISEQKPCKGGGE